MHVVLMIGDHPRHFHVAKEFDGHRFGDVPTLVTDLAGINGEAARRFISIRRPDLLLSFGVHEVEPGPLDAAPKLRWRA